MCRNLLVAGFPLTVYNRTAQRAEPLLALGAVAANSISELAAASDVVIACLDTVAASEAVFLAAEGVVAQARPGTLLIDHSTIAPDLAVRIAQGASARGLDFLDAPVSGGPEGAEQRTLAIMVGGDEGAFARAVPVLEAYGRTVRRMGSAGSGTYAKLVNQLLTFVHGAAAAEAIALAERTGLNLGELAEVLRASFGHSRMLDRTLARVESGNYAAGAALRLYAKDLGLVNDIGEATQVPLPVADAARTLLDAAIREGFGERDIAALRLRYPGS
jgi:3-hydroxyisobutyrate dehydrogenase-like beta-hydroxyacid dehydrogenase